MKMLVIFTQICSVKNVGSLQKTSKRQRCFQGEEAQGEVGSLTTLLRSWETAIQKGTESPEVGQTQKRQKEESSELDLPQEGFSRENTLK